MVFFLGFIPTHSLPIEPDDWSLEDGDLVHQALAAARRGAHHHVLRVTERVQRLRLRAPVSCQGESGTTDGGEIQKPQREMKPLLKA